MCQAIRRGPFMFRQKGVKMLLSVSAKDTLGKIWDANKKESKDNGHEDEWTQDMESYRANKQNIMNVTNFIFLLLLSLATVVQGVPIRDYFLSPDNDSGNRLNEHLYATSILPMRGGGGYPSTTGNPSGGGRWND